MVGALKQLERSPGLTWLVMKPRRPLYALGYPWRALRRFSLDDLLGCLGTVNALCMCLGASYK